MKVTVGICGFCDRQAVVLEKNGASACIECAREIQDALVAVFRSPSPPKCSKCSGDWFRCPCVAEVIR